MTFMMSLPSILALTLSLDKAISCISSFDVSLAILILALNLPFT